MQGLQEKKPYSKGEVFHRKNSVSPVSKQSTCSVIARNALILGAKVCKISSCMVQPAKNLRKNQRHLDPNPCSTKKSLLHVIELSVSSKSKTDNALLLCDFASNQSWLSASLVLPSNLSWKKLYMTLNSFNSTDTISTELVGVTLSADISNTDYTFKKLAFVFGKPRVANEVFVQSEAEFSDI